MKALPSGMITVEEAAGRVGWVPGVLRDCAALGGYPRGYGPFLSVPGSVYRIAIDEADLERWRAAGFPRSTYYQDRPVIVSPPKRSWWERVERRWRGEE